MQTLQPDIETFLGVVSHCKERREVIEAIKVLRHTKDYKCPSSAVLALHLIVDLYGEDSSLQANINRITTNLEAAADELNYLSKQMKTLK
jgi:hypothetical protein